MKKLVLAALILSAVTGIFAYQYLKGLEKKYEYKTRAVVVAAVQIPDHTEITADMVAVVNLPEEAVHQLSSDNALDIVGKVAKENIEPNEQILNTKLGNADDEESDLAYIIKTGYRAMTIETDDISGVAGEIKKGDRIDIAAILLSEENGVSELKTMLIAENIEVLKVGIAQDVEGASNTSVTVSVLAEDVLRLSYALSEGKYRLVLRSAVDRDIKNPPEYIMK